jgi:hypothetical protein
MMAVDVTTQPAFSAGKPGMLFRSILDDDRHLAILQRISGRSEIPDDQAWWCRIGSTS